MKKKQRNESLIEATLLYNRRKMKLSKQDEILNILPFLGDVPKENWKEIPLSSGVYILKDVNKEVIYVGKSMELRKRVYTHIKGFKTNNARDYTKEISEEVEYIAYCEFPLVSEIDIYETILINHLRPFYNIDKVDSSRTSFNVDSIHRVIEAQNMVYEQEFESLEEFLLKLFKANRNVEIGVATLKMICENNGYASDVVGTRMSLSRLKNIGIAYRNGVFTYTG